MADFSIALSSIQNTKTVNIKGLGLLTVRKMGSGEELQISSYLRRMGKILDELQGMDFSKLDTSKPEHLKIMQRMSKKAETLGDELDTIKHQEFNIYKSLLTDDQDGKVVDVIMNTLSDKGRSELFKMIFGEVSQVESPESTETPEGKQKND